jgi:hypothetical protein
MAKELAKLFVTIGLDDKELQSGLNKAQKTIQQWSKGFAIAGAAITAALGFATKQALDEEVGINRLSSALKAVGEDYSALSGEIEKSLAATQAKTNYGDESQRDALVELINVTGTYQGALDQLKLATDLAAAKDMDLVSAATLVGRAATGNTELLSRYGIQVDKGATATEVLATMQERFAGAAEGAANPLKQLSNAFGDLVQDIGKQLVPLLKSLVEKLLPVIQGIRNWIAEHPKLTQVLVVATAALGLMLSGLATLGFILPIIAKWLTTAITLFQLKAIALKVVTAAQWLWNVAMNANPIGLIIAGIAALTGLIYGLAKAWNSIVSFFTGGSRDSAQAVRELTDEEKSLAASIEETKSKIQALNDEQAKNQSLLESAKDKYDSADTSTTTFAGEVENLKNNLSNTNFELEKARDKLDGIQESYNAAAEKVRSFEDAVNDANRELEALSRPRLEGMQEFEDQIFNVEEQIKKLQLEKLTTAGDTEALDAQIEALQKQKDILELQRDLKYDEITRQAKEAVETIQGLNEEMMPQAVLDRIAELGRELSPSGELGAGLAAAQEALAGQTEALNAQKNVVNELEQAAKGYQDRLDEINQIVKELYWNLTQYLEGVIKNTQADIEAANQELDDSEQKLKELKEAADQVFKQMLQDAKDIRDALEAAARASDRATAPQPPPSLPSFQGWEGPLPGPMGQPYPAIVHGGEIISQPGRQPAGTGSQFSMGAVTEAIRQGLANGLAGMLIKVEVGGKEVAAIVSREQYRMRQFRT